MNVEYYNAEKQQSLLDELRQHEIDVTRPNALDFKYHFTKLSLNIIKEFRDIISDHNYIILRNFSELAIDAMKLARLLGDELFFQGNNLGYMYQFKTQPFQTEIFSSSLECGGFHTDFWTLKEIPNYIMIQCIKPDPKHPYYSRNQIVLLSSLLKRLEELFPNITDKLIDIVLPHKVKNEIKWVKLLTKCNDKFSIRLHPKYVSEKDLSSLHYIGDIPIHQLISTISQELSIDFVLDSKDIFVVSNKFCLHRRGESTIRFQKNPSEWHGREINTLRFF